MTMSAFPRNILVSAGEASGDLYAAMLVKELQSRWPDTRFFGCTGPKLREAGVETIVASESLAVVGLVEVLGHLPRIYREYRKLLRAAEASRPEIAILTDSPDFHLRVARRLAGWRIPVVYLVAPQVWAWRKGRVKLLRRYLSRLLCIFPFEEEFFRGHRVPVTYIGHPLASLVRPALTREEFFRKHGIPDDRPLIALLPGSRRGEAGRHLPELVGAVERIRRERPAHFVLPASPHLGAAFFRERIPAASIQVIDGEAWDTLAHCSLALAASGTVTVEGAILGAPMVTFYRVNPLSWWMGKLLVRVPFYSMVNLIAGRKIVPELMQDEMTAARLGEEALRLLANEELRARMRADLADVAARLSMAGSAIGRAAGEVIAVREASLVASIV